MGPLKLNTDETTQTKLADAGILPGIDKDIIYSVNWVILYGTKYCKSAIVIVKVSDNLLPVFGEISQFWCIRDYIYIEYFELETLSFHERF